MLKIKIHKIEFSLLSNLISSQLISLLLYEIVGEYYLIEAPKDTFEKILDKLSDILSEKGFHENNEPNSLGRKIEALIDKFSEKVYN